MPVLRCKHVTIWGQDREEVQARKGKLGASHCQGDIPQDVVRAPFSGGHEEALTTSFQGTSTGRAGRMHVQPVTCKKAGPSFAKALYPRALSC